MDRFFEIEPAELSDKWCQYDSDGTKMIVTPIRDVIKTNKRFFGRELRNEVIGGRIVFEVPTIYDIDENGEQKLVHLSKNRRHEFNRKWLVDDNDPTSIIRFSAFNEKAHHIMNKIEVGQCYLFKNFQVLYSNPATNSLPHKFELSFHESTIIIPMDDVPSIRRDMLYNFIPIKNINSLEKNSCIDIQGIVMDFKELSEWRGFFTKKQFCTREIMIMDRSLHSFRLKLWGNKARWFSVERGGVIRIHGVKIQVQGPQENRDRFATELLCSDHQENPTDASAQRLKDWYEKDGKKKKVTEVPLVDRRERVYAKHERARAYLNKNKCTQREAAATEGISEQNFCIYLSRFRQPRKQRKYEPWRHEAAVQMVLNGSTIKAAAEALELQRPHLSNRMKKFRPSRSYSSPAETEDKYETARNLMIAGKSFTQAYSQVKVEHNRLKAYIEANPHPKIKIKSVEMSTPAEVKDRAWEARSFMLERYSLSAASKKATVQRPKVKALLEQFPLLLGKIQRPW